MKLTTKKQLMARYTILFAIISLIVFYLFYKNGVTFIWGAKGQDGLSQHINALMYWGEYIRNFFFNIIHGHFRFPMWDMSIGFGADILGTLNYYAIGDPLNLIYVFSNKSNIELLYNFMLVFRLYLAGVAYRIWTLSEKRWKWNLSRSIVYIFSGTFFHLRTSSVFPKSNDLSSIIIDGSREDLQKRKTIFIYTYGNGRSD